jgi:hypothetical protein
MDERDGKRKREVETESVLPDGAIESLPKRHKTEKIDDLPPNDSKSTSAKRREKRERKKEKDGRRKDKDKEKQKRRKEKFKAEARANFGDIDSADQPEVDSHINDMEQMDITGLDENTQDPHNDASSRDHSPTPESAFSHESEQPPASSTSSPPTGIESAIVKSLEPPPKSLATTISRPPRPSAIDIPKVDHDTIKARLQSRIEALRAARKADGPDGRPARSRAELIEARRKKQEARKLNKKELRQAAKEEEQNASTEVELARLRGSGSPMTNGSDLFSPSVVETSYSFGRIGFSDGSHLGANGSIIDAQKSRGPMDARSALMVAEKKKERLGALDEKKRNDIEDKDMWLNARKKIHGEHVRDEVSLLKKTLKRKEKSKSKSENEWKAREEGVRKGKEARQRKREENLTKRREEKGKGKKKSKGANKKKLRNKAFGNLK